MGSLKFLTFSNVAALSVISRLDIPTNNFRTSKYLETFVFPMLAGQFLALISLQRYAYLKKICALHKPLQCNYFPKKT